MCVGGSTKKRLRKSHKHTILVQINHGLVTVLCIFIKTHRKSFPQFLERNVLHIPLIPIDFWVRENGPGLLVKNTRDGFAVKGSVKLLDFGTSLGLARTFLPGKWVMKASNRP